MIRALPVQLRHLEKKPLVVEKMDFVGLGFTGVKMFSFSFDQNSDSKKEGLREDESGDLFDNNDSDEDFALERNGDNNLQDKSFSSSSRVRTNSTGNKSAAGNSTPTVTTVPSATSSKCPNKKTVNLVIDIFALDINNAGLDARVFKYWWERKLLIALYKNNAGMVIKISL